MTFLLSALKIFYVLDLDLALISQPHEDDTEEIKKAHKKRNEDELYAMDTF